MRNPDPLEVERLEKRVLFKFSRLFQESLGEFFTSVDKSMAYLEHLVLPIVMASKEDKSYNPFAEIMEKYALHILSKRLERAGYTLLPLGYSADLTMDGESHILNIDIKTANLDNPSDFRGTIPVGINQITHVARLKLGKEFLPKPFFVYPNVPPVYCEGERCKPVLTYGLMFLYPPYRDLVEEVRNSYLELREFFEERVKSTLIPILGETLGVDEGEALSLLNYRPQKVRSTRLEILAENVIRGIILHENHRKMLLKSLGMSGHEEVLTRFSNLLKEFAGGLRNKNIRPIAIIAISIPNGLLWEYYMDDFVSGKNYGRSARYHYADGIFKVIREREGKTFPRVVFLSLDEEHLKTLEKYFPRIYRLEYGERV
ncbi:hypothetical protein [Thermococcus sp.]|uniref:hypothetical protein n=1 Tax=Thermococcus sp. TaxID=35749 RepID=UPI0026323DDF|nr:hypothetical protein [Thermococcus sp.]